MINYKSPYDSNQIRQGLMNIKQSQMELLKQLKNQNHILKKYTPSDPIYEQRSQQNIFQNSSQGFSTKENFESNFPSNQKVSYGNNSYSSSNQRGFQDNLRFNTAPKNQNNSIFQKQLQDMTEDFHRMKKNYFTEKQKNKDMILHMQFAASLHNLILKELLQGNNIQTIKSKVRSEVNSYQSEFPQFKAFGLEQAFNIINLQSDGSFIQSKSSYNRRAPIFPPRSPNTFQNTQFLKEINDLKCQLKQLSLQKQRKTQQVTLIKSQHEYTASLLNKQIQVKNNKINDIVSQLLRIKQSGKNLSIENSDLKNNMQRLKSQLQRNINKVQSLQNCERRTNETIQKEHKYMKYLKQMEQKIAFLDKQGKQKQKLIQIHQENLNKVNQMFKSLKLENSKFKTQIQELRKLNLSKSTHNTQLQEKLQKVQFNHTQDTKMLNKRNQSQQISLKQHIQQLKKNVQQLLYQQESYKQSELILHEMKFRKNQGMKFSKTIDHLWRIKEVEYQNINQVVTQLNQIKLFNSQLNIKNQNINQFRKQHPFSNNLKNKPRSSSRSKSKENSKKI